MNSADNGVALQMTLRVPTSFLKYIQILYTGFNIYIVQRNGDGSSLHGWTKSYV